MLMENYYHLQLILEIHLHFWSFNPPGSVASENKIDVLVVSSAVYSAHLSCQAQKSCTGSFCNTLARAVLALSLYLPPPLGLVDHLALGGQLQHAQHPHAAQGQPVRLTQASSHSSRCDAESSVSQVSPDGPVVD